jgi:hypothetical protein
MITSFKGDIFVDGSEFLGHLGSSGLKGELDDLQTLGH